MQKTPSFCKDRQLGPRISLPGTYDDYYANRYKELFEEYKFAMNDMKLQFLYEHEKLDVECAKLKYDQETEELKLMIREREKERKRLDTLRQMKRNKLSPSSTLCKTAHPKYETGDNSLYDVSTYVLDKCGLISLNN